MTFQKTVLIIEVIILILTLSMIGYMLWKAKGSTRYPPEISMCPDFWEVVEKKNDQPGMGIQRGRLLCKPNPDLGDKGNIGKFIGKQFDFGKPEYQGPNGIRRKKNWADGLDIYWDGITEMYAKGPKPAGSR